jgi:photosystem II stability/assembly factor-like uncharacterized protein
MRHLLFTILVLTLIVPFAHAAEDEADDAKLSASTLSALKFRNIGPAINSGRVSDFAVTPDKRHRFFVAVASGGVWKTENAGTTWTPVFDGEGSYSIGTITMDPHNPNVIWVGTGENNSQRSVSFGDGVYKSLDGGQSWTNVGLPDSEHIGGIAIDPRDTDVVYVAAQGPLWRSGGDRGLYKTTDGGTTWERILHVDEDTGANEVWLDPRDPDTLYASTYQRRRHVWTLINGGPGSGIWKSTDAGATWRELERGLPTVDMGRIGLAISPVNPDVLYAIVEAQRDEGGVFRSTDRGESWSKRSDYMSRSPQYYNELVADPHDLDTVYSLDTILHVSRDGGASFERVNVRHKHVDDHALWLDPGDPDYMLLGCDGGVYESFDRGNSWLFKENLPITQFYRVFADDARPFYRVFGGTQDNNSMGGPSRTLRSEGISNEDWFITVGGDGYETVVDPTNPDIIYSQWQYGGLVRYDRRSEEIVDIQPQEEPAEDAHRWNWDSPLILSPHSPTRLYYAAQRVFRTDDRGDTWTAISGDLSRNLDPNQLPVMGRIWGMDAVSKNLSTSNYGNVVSLSESPLVEGLLYAGTDDGLIQVTEDGGENWREIASFPGVPERAYVSDLEASLHDEDTVYASFVNYKMGDFSPYILVSRDRGRTWTSAVGDLPERQIVHALIQDHVKPELLFAGTEFGVFVTFDGGSAWHQLKGLPTIQARDIDIQRRVDDLVIATFGRGFWILDDYSVLREVSEEALAGNESLLFPSREALRYVEKRNRQGSRGDGFWTTPNPPYGAVFTYWLRDGLKTAKELRTEAEKEARKADTDPPLPSMAALRDEDLEIEPELVLVIRDEVGEIVRRVPAERKAGLHRVAWDLRWPAADPVTLGGGSRSPWWEPPRGPLALPGRYEATLERRVDGVSTALAGPVPFDVIPLDLATFTAEDKAAVMAFQADVRELRRRVQGATRASGEMRQRIDHLRVALRDTPAAPAALSERLEDIRRGLDVVDLELSGDDTKSQRNVFQPPSIAARVGRIASDMWSHTQAPTTTHRQSLAWAADAFEAQLAELQLLDTQLRELEGQAEDAGAPWTPGRMPR